jgi:predicted ATPase
MIKGELLAIVLTGGPCAGKTSALSQLMEWLTDLGYRVAVVPESVTELKNAGIRPENYDDGLFFQEIVLESICNKEELFAKALSRMKTSDSSKPAILLCDRGIMDAEAYIGEATFTMFLLGNNMNLSNACDKRYAGIIHLRTAADGAEEYYTLSNNAARDETPAEARALDRLTEKAWQGLAMAPVLSFTPSKKITRA